MPITGEQTKDGAFDGGYAFADYCPNGYDLDADDGTCVGGRPGRRWSPAPTSPTRSCRTTPPTAGPCNPAGAVGQQVTDPKGAIPGGGAGCLYRPVSEEDVNVDLGNQFTPAIPPPPCTGDDHVIDQSTLTPRSNYYGSAGAHAPLCDKRLVVLQNGAERQRRLPPDDQLPHRPQRQERQRHPDPGDVAEPGRIIGLVFNDIYFERDPQSLWYGEPRPIARHPGRDLRPRRHRAERQPAVRRQQLAAVHHGDDQPGGTYEALLPSTETLNCPIPQGPCPGMYLVMVDDPGTQGSIPNANYNPNLLTATSAWDVWPGLTDQLDTPLDPISGNGCEDPAVPARPELLQVSHPASCTAAAAVDHRSRPTSSAPRPAPSP